MELVTSVPRMSKDDFESILNSNMQVYVSLPSFPLLPCISPLNLLSLFLINFLPSLLPSFLPSFLSAFPHSLARSLRSFLFSFSFLTSLFFLSFLPPSRVQPFLRSYLFVHSFLFSFFLTSLSPSFANLQ